MGVRGLTTFIANRSGQYLERYELHDTYVVIDGNSIASQLYKWHCRSNDCFGGDYDKYSNVVKNFFKLLADCNVTPLLVFDGAYEQRKLKTVYTRMKNKIEAAKNLNSVNEGSISLFPLFLRELFVDLVLELGIQSVRCDFEGDNDAAHLARTLRCPLVSYDSDFYIFDVWYILFSTVDLCLRKNKGVPYIECQVYKVEKFLNSVGGMDKRNLPLLAVMLGNDYIKKRAFSAFYRQLKMHKTKQNEQQTQIKSVITWLKNESPESALRKILGRYKLRYRKTLALKIQKAIEAYQSGNTPVCSYFNIKDSNETNTVISVPEPEDIENLEDQLEEEEESSESSQEEEKEVDRRQKREIPAFFRENFRKCLYPPCFMDIITSNTYFCIQQMEDFSTEPSHNVSFKILGAIFKILTFPRRRPLICLARNGHTNVKKYTVPLYEEKLPELTDIENIDMATSRTTFLEILNVQDNVFDKFPQSWHLFLISVKYWISNSKVDVSSIYSLCLCSLVLNVVDKKLGFYRSTKTFFNKYGTETKGGPFFRNSGLIEALNNIDLNNSIACMHKLIHFFQMDEKMKSNLRLFDRAIVHQFAQFQSCILHIKYLNALLNSPFPTCVISDFFNGTFVYNMTTNLQKRTDLKAYVKLLLQDCPQILSVFEMMIEVIESEVGVGRHEPLKKRRRKKKGVKCVVDVEVEVQEDEEEYCYDANNKYSLLFFHE